MIQMVEEPASIRFVHRADDLSRFALKQAVFERWNSERPEFGRLTQASGCSPRAQESDSSCHFRPPQEELDDVYLNLNL